MIHEHSFVLGTWVNYAVVVARWTLCEMIIVMLNIPVSRTGTSPISSSSTIRLRITFFQIPPTNVYMSIWSALLTFSPPPRRNVIKHAQIYLNVKLWGIHNIEFTQNGCLWNLFHVCIKMVCKYNWLRF